MTLQLVQIASVSAIILSLITGLILGVPEEGEATTTTLADACWHCDAVLTDDVGTCDGSAASGASVSFGPLSPFDGECNFDCDVTEGCYYSVTVTMLVSHTASASCTFQIRHRINGAEWDDDDWEDLGEGPVAPGNIAIDGFSKQFEDCNVTRDTQISCCGGTALVNFECGPCE